MTLTTCPTGCSGGIFTPINGRKAFTGVAEVYLAALTSLAEMVAGDGVDPLLNQILAGRSVTVPTTRERAEDVDEAIEALMQSGAEGEGLPHISPMAAQLLRAHAWPGKLTDARAKHRRSWRVCLETRASQIWT